MIPLPHTAPIRNPRPRPRPHKKHSVDETPTLFRATVTGDAGRLIRLQRELVVVAELLPHPHVALGVDDDLLGALHRDDARRAAGVAAVVDESSEAPLESRVDHGVLFGRRCCF